MIERDGYQIVGTKNGPAILLSEDGEYYGSHPNSGMASLALDMHAMIDELMGLGYEIENSEGIWRWKRDGDADFHGSHRFELEAWMSAWFDALHAGLLEPACAEKE